MQKEGLVNKT